MTLSVFEVIIRLVVACACGGIIGFNRGKQNRPAGIRTHVIICMGSALTVILGLYFAAMARSEWIGAMTSAIDITRMGAQVISGIGFIGVGTIVVTGKQKIKGLTTAAGLWASACMGIAIGAGFYLAALIGCVLIAVTVVFLGKLENHLFLKSRNMSIYVEFKSVEGISGVIESLQNAGIDVLNVDVDVTQEDDGKTRDSAVLSMKLPKGASHESAVAIVGMSDCIHSVEEL